MLASTPARAASTVGTAERILEAFAERTGLVGEGDPSARSLRVDAFAVCGFLELHRQTGQRHALELAERLVLEHAGSEAERGAGGACEADRIEWVHALTRFGGVTRRGSVLRRARELARSVAAALSAPPPLDALDGLPLPHEEDLRTGRIDPSATTIRARKTLRGLIAMLEVRAASRRDALPDLSDAIAELDARVDGLEWATQDEADLGSLLCAAHALTQWLARRRTVGRARLLERLLESSALGLDAFARSRHLEEPVESRAPDRELALTIGLHAIRPMSDLLDRARRHGLRRSARIASGSRAFVPLSAAIERCWLEEWSRASAWWRPRRDLNDVMLATSLAPGTYLSV